MVSKTKVYPSKREVKGECPLVIFDLPYVTFYYNQVVLRYKGGDFEERVKKLKEGLGLALVHFYPLSGRLGSDEEVVLLVENCGMDDTGVGVIEAVAIDIGVDELLAKNTARQPAGDRGGARAECDRFTSRNGDHWPFRGVGSIT